MKRIQIIPGHYGSGKTEYAVNLALHLVQEHENVALADMDIVNPYFRSYEQAKRLEEAGVRVIVTSCGGIADIPAINPEVMSIFQQEKWTGVLDIGGDPIGARVLARFAPQLKPEDFDLYFVLNANRPETRTVDSALEYMRAIEAECRQKVTGIINNTHLCAETTPEEIIKGANKQVENTIKTIKESQAEKETTQEARKELQGFMSILAARKEKEQKDKDDYIEKKIKQIDARRERQKQRKVQRADEKAQQEIREQIAEQERLRAFRSAPLTVGEKVRVKENGMVGEVVKLVQKEV